MARDPGIGGALIVGNSFAILTDAFPAGRRGLALGINNIAATSGAFIGLVIGGVLAPVNWRLVFLAPVPFGIFGTIWARARLRELSSRTAEPVDWAGNITFAAGLILIMIGITRGKCGHRGASRTDGRLPGLREVRRRRLHPAPVPPQRDGH
jgi:MFS family permease